MTQDDAFRVLRSLPGDWGAPEDEIRRVEAVIGVRLPIPLRDVMRSTGSEMHMHWLFPDGEIAPLARLP